MPDIAFVSAREGWVALQAPGSGADQCAMELWHTTDAGATYEKLATTGLEQPRQCKYGPSFADGQRGWISGLSSDGTSPVIYRTMDGGKTWTVSRPLPDPPGFTTTSTSFLTPGSVRPFGPTLTLAAGGQSATGGGVLYIFRSFDGGATWTHTATRQAAGSLAFASASRWLEISSPADSMETTDGGSMWHQFATDYQQAAPIGPVVTFSDDSIGYATVRGTLKRTTDGGAHWTGLKTPGT